MKANIKWYEIPVNDFERARRFYEVLLQDQLTVVDLDNLKMGILPGGQGMITKNENYKPSQEGVLIYFDGNPSLDEVETRIANAGGNVLQPKKKISDEMGYMCLFTDSEGNRLAVMSQA